MTLPTHRQLRRFQLKHYGAEAVVYDTASGDTHHLNPLALALYQTCVENPGLLPADIVQTLAQRQPEAGTPDFFRQADETLASLHCIGLLQAS